MKEGLGVVGPALLPTKSVKNNPDLFEPPLFPLLGKGGESSNVS